MLIAATTQSWMSCKVGTQRGDVVVIMIVFCSFPLARDANDELRGRSDVNVAGEGDDAKDVRGRDDVNDVRGRDDVNDVRGRDDAKDVRGRDDVNDVRGRDDVNDVRGRDDAKDVRGRDDVNDVRGRDDAKDVREGDDEKAVYKLSVTGVCLFPTRAPDCGLVGVLNEMEEDCETIVNDFHLLLYDQLRLIGASCDERVQCLVDKVVEYPLNDVVDRHQHQNCQNALWDER
ncbi:hypothetical protein BLNAU_15431 [Blattamonas nauphoetae]|uniref:Uncharacterized protein n=1 Tax=Blattamonas nauphoetae TaxID=2049346 RepID=A0ABQ9XH01_9EUKA|nr:hypothetical protein BLNAU_15431 [Blattamonas nauphoetae]